MSIARHHTEWLSLVENAGLFLSLGVLSKAFPQGLDSLDADTTAELRPGLRRVAGCCLWRAAGPGVSAPGCAGRSSVCWVTRRTCCALGQMKVQRSASRCLEHGETIQAGALIAAPGPESAPRVLVLLAPPGQNLDSRCRRRCGRRRP